MEQREKLTLSGLQHSAFCRRQWALIFVEQQWQENYLTAAGSVMHQRAHDVSTADAAGKRRLRRVAKACVAHGQRVQNSVFECSLDAAQLCSLKAELTRLIDPERDSLRFYQLGNAYRSKLEHVGAKAGYLPDDVLML